MHIWNCRYLCVRTEKDLNQASEAPSEHHHHHHHDHQPHIDIAAPRRAAPMYANCCCFCTSNVNTGRDRHVREIMPSRMLANGSRNVAITQLKQI